MKQGDMMKLSAVTPVAPLQSTPDLVPMAEHPDLTEVRSEIAGFESRLAEAHARLGRAKAARAASVTGAALKATGDLMQQAKQLAAGNAVSSSDPDAEIVAAEHEIRILRSAIGQLADDRAAIESRLNYETSKQFRERNADAFRRLDAAIGQAFRAFSDVHDIFATMKAAGYTPHATVLPTQVPPALYRLGDPADTRSEAWRFREWVRQTFPTGA